MAFGELPLEASQQLTEVGVPRGHVALRRLSGDALDPAHFGDRAAFPTEPVHEFESGALLRGSMLR